MNTLELNLFMALYNEHKQRTSHNIFEADFNQRLSRCCCPVCINLRLLKDKMEKDERDYYEDMEKEHFIQTIADIKNNDSKE